MKLNLGNIFLNTVIALGIALLLLGGYGYFTRTSQTGDKQNLDAIFTHHQRIELEKAYISCQEKKFDEAEQIIRTLIKDDPDNLHLRHELGVVLGLEHKFKEAIECFSYIIEKKPDMVLCYFNRAQAKLLSGQFAEAMQDYIAVKILFPYAKQHADMAIEILNKVKQYGQQELKTKFKERVALNQKDITALFSLGQLAMEEQKFDMAKQYFSKVVDFKPEFENAQLALSNALISQNNFDEAIALLERSKKQYPDNVQYRCALGFAYLKNGKFAKAKKEFENILTLTDDNPDCFVGLALLALLNGNNKVAVEQFKKTIQLSPNYHQARNLLGVALISLGLFDEAINQYNYILQHDSSVIGAYRNLGDAYLRKSDYPKAVEYYKKYLELVPDDPERESLEDFIKSVEK